MSSLPPATAPARDRRKYKRRLSNYLLNKQLQLRYIGFATVLSAVLCSTLGYLIWQQSTAASSSIRDSADAELCASLVGDCDELKADIAEGLEQQDTFRAVTMVGVGVCLVLVLTLFLLIMTHKVAGPLYKVRKYFDHMANGRVGEVYPLRQGDMLQDFYTKFMEMNDAVRARHTAENELFGRFLKACQEAGVPREDELGDALARLEAHVEARDEALS